MSGKRWTKAVSTNELNTQNRYSMNKPFMLYFGPLEESGHWMYHDNGAKAFKWTREGCPWSDLDIDGPLQPGQPHPEDRLKRRTRPMREGEALLHHKEGWTALCFWDSTIDTRPGCSSTYIAKGVFTFEEMVGLAKERFAERWNKMRFTVTLVA